jgi:hypothetical protein
MVGELPSHIYELVARGNSKKKTNINYTRGVVMLAYRLIKHPNAQPKMEIRLSPVGIAKHKGLGEVGLAFGVSMPGDIFKALLIIFIDAMKQAYPARITVSGFMVLILINKTYCLKHNKWHRSNWSR